MGFPPLQGCRANLTPPPVQKPHPPVYIAATRTPATLEFVLSTGHPLIVGVVLDTLDALDLCKRFVAMSRESGKNVPMSAIPFFRYFYVAETEDQARQDTEEALNWTMDVNQWRRVFSQGSELHTGSLADFRAARTELPPSYDYLYQKRAFIGTPDQCAKKIQALRDQGIEYFGCNFSFGDMDHQNVLKSMELFSKEVMPRFQ
jgi:alkanesulfonate monooxygenase SsuD/methylene tetrahydromethanopterin reductase-like flavin-dependent oxidoreductase (luciferase family)